jgi:hypothetical protein
VRHWITDSLEENEIDKCLDETVTWSCRSDTELLTRNKKVRSINVWMRRLLDRAGAASNYWTAAQSSRKCKTCLYPSFVKFSTSVMCLSALSELRCSSILFAVHCSFYHLHSHRPELLLANWTLLVYYSLMSGADARSQRSRQYRINFSQLRSFNSTLYALCILFNQVPVLWLT